MLLIPPGRERAAGGPDGRHPSTAPLNPPPPALLPASDRAQKVRGDSCLPVPAGCGAPLQPGPASSKAAPRSEAFLSSYGLQCVPSNPYVEVLTPVPQNVTVFGDGTFQEVIKLKSGY